jgi:hypothetical protein
MRAIITGPNGISNKFALIPPKHNPPLINRNIVRLKLQFLNNFFIRKIPIEHTHLPKKRPMIPLQILLRYQLFKLIFVL